MGFVIGNEVVLFWRILFVYWSCDVLYMELLVEKNVECCAMENVRWCGGGIFDCGFCKVCNGIDCVMDGWGSMGLE